MLLTSLLCPPLSAELSLQQRLFFREHTGREDEEKGNPQLCACTCESVAELSMQCMHTGLCVWVYMWLRYVHACGAVLCVAVCLCVEGCR